jgi:hypothetical protein
MKKNLFKTYFLLIVTFDSIDISCWQNDKHLLRHELKKEY